MDIGEPAKPTESLPAASPREEYEALRRRRRAETADTFFVLNGRPLLLARPPFRTVSKAPDGPLQETKPGEMFDLAKRVEGVQPLDFYRRGIFGGTGSMTFMDTLPALGVGEALKMVVKPAAEVALNVMGDNHVVIGVCAGGESRAYPLRLANCHEVINDTLGDSAILVTWSALALSAQAFVRRLPDGTTPCFGSAGLLYQGAIVCYDRETYSLWSPTKHQCLAGPLAGTPLEPLPVAVTTWKEWTRLHPETTALVGTDPILKLNYDGNPAAPPGYYMDRRVLYPVEGLDVTDTPMALKALVFGVSMPDGHAKAYEAGMLTEATGPIHDEIGGRGVVLEYDSKANILSATTEAGEPLIVEGMYWFAWFGAHPDTEVWQEERMRGLLTAETQESAKAGGDTVATAAVSQEPAPSD